MEKQADFMSKNCGVFWVKYEVENLKPDEMTDIQSEKTPMTSHPTSYALVTFVSFAFLWLYCKRAQQIDSMKKKTATQVSITAA